MESRFQPPAFPPCPRATGFRIYVESSGPIGQVGSIQSGLAISNPRPIRVTVQLTIFNMDGTPTGLTSSIDIPGGGQIAKYVDEIVNLPEYLQRRHKLTAETPVVVTSLRTRYNERRDLLVTTTLHGMKRTGRSTWKWTFPTLWPVEAMTRSSFFLRPDRLFQFRKTVADVAERRAVHVASIAADALRVYLYFSGAGCSGRSSLPDRYSMRPLLN